jgi:hypothetical protein
MPMDIFRTITDDMGLTDSMTRTHETVEVDNKVLLGYKITDKLSMIIAGMRTLLFQGDLVISEDLSSQADGVDDTFTTNNKYVTDSLRVHVNGLRQMKGAAFDFTESTTTTFTFASAAIPVSGDIVQVDYFKSST